MCSWNLELFPKVIYWHCWPSIHHSSQVNIFKVCFFTFLSWGNLEVILKKWLNSNFWKGTFFFNAALRGFSFLHLYTPIQTVRHVPFAIPGVGIVCFLKLFIVAIYFNVLLGNILYYMYVTVSYSPWPWASCSNAWNTGSCEDSKPTNVSSDPNDWNYQSYVTVDYDPW